MQEMLAAPVCYTANGALIDELGMFADRRGLRWVRTKDLLSQKAVPNSKIEAVLRAAAQG